MQKVRCHFKKHQLLVSIKFQIFSIFYFNKYSFHLSLTVLLHYQSSKSLDLRMVPHYSNNITYIILLFYNNFFILQG